MKNRFLLLAAGLFAAVMAFSAPVGSKGGRFTVDANGTQVRFAQGNLQYHVRNKVWQFAVRQDSVIGEPNEGRIEANYNNWIDLFAWGTSGYNNKNPEMYSYTSSDYAYGNKTDIAGTNYDWGQYCAISNGGNQAGLWRTLTKDEWMYLFNNRTNASQLMGFGAVNGLIGFILLPDGWTTPAGGHFTPVAEDRAQNNYTLVDWEIMENAGAIFLPDAGYASPNSSNIVSWSGPKRSSNPTIGSMSSRYMSSTASNTSSYYCFQLARSLSSYDDNTNKVKNANTNNFRVENPVRLAMTVHEYTVLFKGPQGETLLEVPVEYGCAVTPPAAPAWAGHTFTGWTTPDPMTLDYITGPTTFTAQYEERTTYTVVFIDTYDATVLKTETVEPNAAATAPDEPSHNADGYTFLSWDKDFSHVTGNMVVYPNYRYGVRIAGEFITDLNRTDLSGIEGVTVGTGGSISFTPASKTLILNNVTITTPNVTWGVFNATLKGLRIEIRGTVDLHTPYCIALRTDVNTTIVGAAGTEPLLKVRNDGPLDHQVGEAGAGMCYTALTTWPNCNLNIEDCTVQVEGAGGVKAQGSSVITLKRVHLTSKVIGTPTSDKQRLVMYSFLSETEPVLIGCEPMSPEGLAYCSTCDPKGYAVNGELTRGEMEIGMPTPPCQDKTYAFTETACGEFTWNGQKYTESGEYSQTFQIEGGCDSIAIMHLTIHPTYNHVISVETTDNPYVWEGSSYTESGTYTKVLETILGCDSTVTLSLTIGEIPEPTCETKFFEFSAEAESEYVWEGQTYTVSGDYERVLKQKNNTCDSIVTLHLTIGGVAPTPTKTYYVAGNGEEGNPWCHGKYWDPAGSPMINGSITFYDVPAGTYFFKITDGEWGEGHEWAFGSVNQSCSSENVVNGGFDEKGNIKFNSMTMQNITITFDGTSICVTAPYGFGEDVKPEIWVYTIVGAFPWFSSDWDPYDSSNDMLMNEDSVCSLTKEGVYAVAGTYEYKVAGNRDYAQFEYPIFENQTLEIPDEGNYDIIFYFDLKTKELWYTLFRNMTPYEAIVAVSDLAEGQKTSYIVKITSAFVSKWEEGYPDEDYATFFITDNPGNMQSYEDRLKVRCVELKGGYEWEQRRLRIGESLSICGYLKRNEDKPEIVNGSYNILNASPEPQYLGWMRIVDFLAIRNFNDTVMLKGMVNDLPENESAAAWKYGYFVLSDETDAIVIHGLLTPEGKAGRFSTLDVINGDQISILAVYDQDEYGNPIVNNAVFVNREPRGNEGIEGVQDAESGIQKVLREGQLFIIRDEKMYNIFGCEVK